MVDLKSMKRKRKSSIPIDCGACHSKSLLDVSGIPRSEVALQRESFIVCGECNDAMLQREEAGELLYFQSHFQESVVLDSSHSCVKINKYLQFEKSSIWNESSTQSSAIASLLLKRAGAILILAGSGMSADSGLTTFRPAETDTDSTVSTGNMHLLDLHDACYHTKPNKAWYYDAGYRRSILSTKPHEGYTLLLKILEVLDVPWFVVTTNIDSYFTQAGFPIDKVYETHGNIRTLQCSRRGNARCQGVFHWPENHPLPPLDDNDLSCDINHVPRCISCGDMARMNISHLPDSPDDIDHTIKSAQRERAKLWISSQRKRLVRPAKAGGSSTKAPGGLLVLEIGVGNTPHGLRGETDILLSKHPQLGFHSTGSLLRINPDCGIRPDHLNPCGQSTARGNPTPLLGGSRDALLTETEPAGGVGGENISCCTCAAMPYCSLDALRMISKGIIKEL